MDEEYADDDEYDEATTDAVDTASRLFSEPTDEELALLKQMKDWAERASAQLDSKAKRTDPLAQRPPPARRQVVRTSGSSSSPNTGPRRTGSRQSWRPRASPAATGS